MQSIVFSSAGLPEGFDDRARLAAWRDFLGEVYGPHIIPALPERPFIQRLQGSRFDHGSTAVDVLRFFGTADRMCWTPRGQAAPRAAHFVLWFNRQAAPLAFRQRNREALLDSESAAITSCTEAGELLAGAPHDFSAVAIDQAALHELVEDVEDSVAAPVSKSAALRHLRRLLDILPVPGDVERDPDFTAHVGTTLIDLVALALGANRDAAAFAKMRGLRAARLQEIIGEIRTRFADPQFSPQGLAKRLGVTDRYIQDLLHEAGPSFTQRVLELRLQRARALLSERRHDRLKIGEIANASGFSEIPYFNRCFRRRFGATPSQFRDR